jgi:hypothetical protein
VKAAVRVQGLGPLVRDFGKMSRELRRDLQREIADSTGIVAREAKAVAEREGLRESGALIRSIKARVRGAVGFVQVGATRRGFPYPRRLEYESGGRRAFVGPALESKQEDVVEAMNDMLDRLASRNGFGRGGIL